MNKLRLFEMFSGYGSTHLGFKRIGIEVESVGMCEIAPKPIEVYKILNGNTKNYGDVSKLEVSELPSMDILTYSFPCQALSYLGKRKGMKKGSGTTSSMLWEVERVVDSKKPKYLVMENVKGLLSKANESDFGEWQKVLEDMGYTNYIHMYNALEFGVPQTRERVFMVSILGEHKPYKFHTPKHDLPLSLRPYLDKEVDKKYYLKKEYLEKLELNFAKTFKTTNIHKLGFISKTYGRGNAGTVIDVNGPCSTILAGFGEGGGNTPHIYNSETGIEGIRRLNPYECLRLMGLTEQEIEKVKALDLADSHVYKMAGNSIVVQMLSEGVYKNLFDL